MSLGHRLFFLVACQSAIAFLLAVLAYRTISEAATDYQQMFDFQFRSVAAIGEAMQEAATLKNGEHSALLDTFYHRYRDEWETAGGASTEAIRFRKDLQRAAETELPRQETQALTDLEKALQEGRANDARRGLTALYDVNVTYAELENHYVMRRSRNGIFRLIVVCVLGIALSVFLGLNVRQAVAPRVQNVVAHIREFQERGITDRIRDVGTDDIAVLTNAVDAGLASIATRDRDQKQFLEVVAHELKTPVTSIYGFASLLIAKPDRDRDNQSAISAIHRQAWRLSRLIDALLLTGQAHSGRLTFEPKPFDMSVLVAHVLSDVDALLSKQVFKAQIQPQVSLLGDEALLEHALWSLFAAAFALSTNDAILPVVFSSAHARARLTIDVPVMKTPNIEAQDLFIPFRFVEYETGSGLRSAIGLHLCREIIRLHNGSLQVHKTPDLLPHFVMELPS